MFDSEQRYCSYCAEDTEQRSHYDEEAPDWICTQCKKARP